MEEQEQGVALRRGMEWHQRPVARGAVGTLGEGPTLHTVHPVHRRTCARHRYWSVYSWR